MSNKVIFGLFEPDTDELIAVVMNEEYADTWATKYDLVVEDFEVDADFEPIMSGTVN